MTALTLFQLIALFLLCMGILGLILRKTLVGMIISLELMLNGAGLSMVAATQLTSADPILGHMGMLFILGLAAAEATLIIAIILVASRRFRSSRNPEMSNGKG
ncbi:MAG: NADH-quinone oxidoreductase subunit K [Deltaproteobacteria bacterium]|nr:NADH-quinone oxidoreductase subunit K [Deltaproteobacteria bacterium]